MAVIAHDTKILSHSPSLYYRLGEPSGSTFANSGSRANADLTKTGTPLMNQASLLKDASGAALRVNTGGATRASVVSATGGWSLSFGINIKTFPAGNTTFLRIGNYVNGQPFINLRVYRTNILKLSVEVGCSSTFMGGEFSGETPDLVADQTMFVTVTCDFATKSLKAYVNGFLALDITTAETILAPTNETLTIQTGDTLDYVLDELAFFPGVAFTASQVQMLFRSFRAIDEAATAFYVSPSGTYFARGTEAEPLSLFYGSRSSLPQPGDTVFLRGGLYEPTVTTEFWFSGSASQRVTIRNYPNELAVIDHRANSNAIRLIGSYLKLLGQDWAQANGLAGIKVTNSNPARLSFKGNYPEFEVIETGTISGTSFTTTDPRVFLHNGSHAGLPFEVLDSVGNIVFSTTIAAVTGLRSATLATGASYTLSSAFKARVVGTDGNRYAGSAIYDVGSENQVIGVWAHGTGDGVTSFVPAVNTAAFYNIFTDLGWMDVENRDHAHAAYWQNSAEVGRKEWIGNVALGCGGSNGKFDSTSGPADNFTIRQNVTLGAGERQNGFLFDLMPVKSGTITITAGQKNGTFTNVTGTLAVGDYVRINGAGLIGTDFYGRIESVSGNTFTIAAAPRRSVTNAIWTVHNRAAFETNAFIGSASSFYPSQGIIIDQNVNLKPFDGRVGNDWRIGYTANNLDVSVTNNVLMGSTICDRWRTFTFTGNVVNTQGNPNDWSAFALAVTKRSDENINWLNYLINNNQYFTTDFRADSNTYPFTLSGVLNSFGTIFLPWVDGANPNNDWQDTTGIDNKFVDAASTFQNTDTGTNIVRLFPQDLVSGLEGAGILSVVNKSGGASVVVNLSSLGLRDGQRFQIRDVECYGEPWGVIFDGIYSTASPSVTVPINVTATAANFAALPGTGTFGTTYQTLDNGNFYRWGTNGAYHQVTSLRTQPVGWTTVGFRPLPSYKPEFLVARILPYAVEIPVGAPNSPSSFAATQVGNSRIDLTWSLTGPTATAVVLEYKRTDQATWTTVNLGAVTSHSLNLVAGSSYNFRIAASNGAGTSLFTLLNRTLTAVFHFGTRPTVSA